MYCRLMNESLKALIENKKALFKALFIPTLVLIGIYFYAPNLIIQDGEAVFDENIKWRFGIIWILILYINMVIAISVHRIILIKDNIPLLRSILPSSTELNFFLKILLFFILTFLVAFLISAFGMMLFMLFVDRNIAMILAAILAFIVVSLLASRFSMVFPAIAINEKMGFSEALNMTKNYKFLSLFMVVIFPIIISVLIAFVYGLIIKFLSGVVSPHFELLYVFLNVFITVLTISCLSVTYSYIKEENDKKSLENEIE
ncbi:hypothetical protein O8C79_02920 [Aliarcobacter butzleri]|uniref:hypothetical protein n=1 Tax=Aliarcobacter butzleri TaxID=28197 RepID=UPI00263ED818|nr:hypothetical protein [Aliarcobacter butzleri]MDN5104246.1 hypothetical protein [Aliarcobacter butzleri]